ncbi:phage integrase SAM-like domain-containing protein [Gelidibacter japonicus]|uniref:phage integrase SAM-like domain-containing protein n=1 Tax=Gelidibacter japonicus TaxID=1962232 RepID=UPI003A956F9B
MTKAGIENPRVGGSSPPPGTIFSLKFKWLLRYLRKRRYRITIAQSLHIFHIVEDMMAKHVIMGGKVHVYKRDNSKYWQCSTFLAGKNHRTSTKEESLSQAKDFAEDWYLELRGKAKTGNLKNEKTFKKAAEQFTREYEVLTDGERNAKYVQDHQARLRNHLTPFFGDYGLSEVTSGAVQDYRIFRMENADKPPSRSTMHHEIVTLRQVLKTAIRHGWLQHLPDLSTPYKMSSKVSHRAWNISVFMKQRGNMPRMAKASLGNGQQNSFMITFCLWQTPDYAPMR